MATMRLVKPEKIPIVPSGPGETIKKEKETFHMSRVDVVRAGLVEAMESQRQGRKDCFIMPLSGLKNAEIRQGFSGDLKTRAGRSC
jgi:hypothetical protein